MIFGFYFVINLISYLNIISSNDEIFKHNINNLNPIKSIISKILYFNVFQKTGFENQTYIIESIKLENNTNLQAIKNSFINSSIIKNNSIINNVLVFTKGKVMIYY